MFNKNDFKLNKKDIDGGHEDYWFAVNGETAEALTDKYMEMCMIGVTEVVYSKDEDVVGVKRLFPFNYDVVMSDNNDLKSMLKELADEN